MRVMGGGSQDDSQCLGNRHRARRGGRKEKQETAASRSLCCCSVLYGAFSSGPWIAWTASLFLAPSLLSLMGHARGLPGFSLAGCQWRAPVGTCREVRGVGARQISALHIPLLQLSGMF